MDICNLKSKHKFTLGRRLVRNTHTPTILYQNMRKHKYNQMNDIIYHTGNIQRHTVNINPHTTIQGVP
jgi:hypothetical protein